MLHANHKGTLLDGTWFELSVINLDENLNDTFLFVINTIIPSHENPSPVNPSLQSHMYDPLPSVQVALS